MKIKKLPNLKLLNELFEYNYTTGFLVWKISRSNIVKVGDNVGCLITKGSNTYYYVRIEGKLYPVHRIIYKMLNPEWDEETLIDHIKHSNPPNNNIKNLREASHQQNIFNKRPKDNRYTKFKGITKRKNNWVAQITYNKKHYHIGSYESEEDAAKAYDNKASELFGKHAFLNFPIDESFGACHNEL